jgi:hypothetical protein
VCVVRVLYPSFYLLNIMKRSSPVRKKMNSNDNSSHSFVSLTFFWHFYAITQNTNTNDEDQPTKNDKQHTNEMHTRWCQQSC